MSDIRELLALLPVDAPWPERCKVDWARVQASTGIWFPRDYRELVELIPSANYGELRVFHPLDSVGDLSVRSLEIFAHVLAVTGESFVGVAENNGAPETFYPQPGGLVPWGISTGGVGYFWAPRSADSDQWTTAIYDEVDEKEYFDLPMVGLLVRIITGRGPLEIIGDFFGERQEFDRHPPS